MDNWDENTSGNLTQDNSVRYDEVGTGTANKWKVYTMAIGQNVANFNVFVGILSSDPKLSVTVFLKKGSPADPASGNYECGPIVITGAQGNLEFDYVRDGPALVRCALPFVRLCLSH